MYLLQTCNKIVFVNKPLNVNTGIYKKKKIGQTLPEKLIVMPNGRKYISLPIRNINFTINRSCATPLFYFEIM